MNPAAWERPSILGSASPLSSTVREAGAALLRRGVVAHQRAFSKPKLLPALIKDGHKSTLDRAQMIPCELGSVLASYVC